MSVTNYSHGKNNHKLLADSSLVMRILSLFFIVLTTPLIVRCQSSDLKNVKLIRSETQDKVDIFIDDTLFTSYHYSHDFEKPFLYPVNAPGGFVITRGFPIEPRKGERVDHPHQVGLWFNHGSVNGIDFWNNSSAIAADKKNEYGHIFVSEIVKAGSGPQGILEVIAQWDDNDGNTILEERTKYIFTATKDTRTIDHLTTLIAVKGPVIILDNKEGLFAIRVDRAFEMPSNEPLVFTDEKGNPTTVAAIDNKGVTGMYISSQGLKGDAVWGTRNNWVLLSGTKDNTQITLAIFDHPDNPGYPAYFHARGYGLFSINNLGQKSYDPKQESKNYSLEKRESMTFNHRFYIQSGSELTPEKADQIFEEFSQVY